MTIFDDLAAEQGRLEEILLGLDETQWLSASGAAGWTIADVVLHLAQSEEGVEATVARRYPRSRLGAAAGDTMDDRAAEAVRAERAAPAEVFGRWQQARAAALAALRAADPDQPVQWVAGMMKPATLATTRLAEHWAHGLDITGPLGIGFPDTPRLRHIAWLAHRTLPYALGLAGQPAVPVRCELTAPAGAPGDGGAADGGAADGTGAGAASAGGSDAASAGGSDAASAGGSDAASAGGSDAASAGGSDAASAGGSDAASAGGSDAAGVWRFGPPDAESAITGTAGEFCRVAAQRLDPAQSGLRVSGPHGATAVRVLRTYAA